MNTATKRFWFAAVSIGVIGTSAFALSDLSEHRAERMNIQLSEMTSVLATQVRGELEHLLHRITDLSERPNPSAVLSEADYDLLNISVWEKTRGGNLVRVSTMRHEPQNAPVADGESSTASPLDLKVVTQGFQGHAVIRMSHQVSLQEDPADTGLIAVPIGGGAGKRVALARFRLGRFQRAFQVDGQMETLLINPNGEIFAHREASKVGRISPMAQKIFGDLSGLREGEFNFAETSNPEKHYAFKLISQGQLAVLTDRPVTDGSLSNRELVMFWGLVSIFLGAGWTLISYSAVFQAKPAKKSATKNGSERSAQESWDGPPIFILAPQRKLIAVLQVDLLPQDPSLEKTSPEELVSVFNDFFEIGASLASHAQGVLERASGSSFVVSWEDPSLAVRCALKLRQEFFNYSEAQKIDGKPPVSVVMGIDWGMGLVAVVGPAKEKTRTTVGEVLVRARALAQLAPSVDTDFLASQAFWEQIAAGFVGESVAEANLTSMSGLTACYRIKGYRDDDGRSVLMHLPTMFPETSAAAPKLMQLRPSADRWMVNNGTQITGPFSALDIAARLYALDLDFDCECWSEGTGQRKTIATSGIFGEPGDPESSSVMWVYDGKTVHGPMTEGFLKTALQHGAIQIDALVCRQTTVSGWKKMAEVVPGLSVSTDASATVLQDPPAAA